AGEREFPLMPLATPAHPGTPARLLEFASVQMFVNRAQAARNDFQLTARNAAAVAALCEKLEGIPLAIELAAGWAETLTPAQTLQRLERRFDLLVARRRDLPPRHRTLRAAVESSYEELPADARRFFARLSVFRGGWTLDAAAGVTGDGDGAALAHLTELRERSLVTARPAADGDVEAYRFAMLETLREFAEEQLPPDEAEELARRHAAFYADLAERAEPGLRGPDQVAWLERLEREHPNLRAALERSAADPGRGDHAVGLRIAASVWRFWMLRGHFAEGRRHLERVLAAPPDEGSRRVRAAALHGAGCLARLQGDTAAARPLLEEALAGMRSAAGTPLNVAMCLQNLAIVAQDEGDYAAARAGYEEALALRRAAGDLDGAANVLNSLGVLAWDLGDVAASRAFHEESVALRRALGQPPRAAQLFNLASVADRQGDAAAARAWYEEGVSLARGAGNLHTLATGLGGLALLAGREGRTAETAAHFSEALRLFLEVGDLGSLAQTLEGCAAALATGGRGDLLPAAARLWGAAAAYRARTGIPLSPGERGEHELAVAAARATFGDHLFDAAVAAGSLLAPDRAVEEARAALAAFAGGENNS
ncbi:MAG TPA: tetratricopeptide repeat protein, partial [Armatimonadaceae bacterium]|nr:tetratricopeptide repeat protein [Armatimonadaceae bacterium]